MKQQAIVYVITKLELGGAQKVCVSLFNHCRDSSRETFLISSSDGPLINELARRRGTFLLPCLQRTVGLRLLCNELKALIVITRIVRRLKKRFAHLTVHTHSTKA